MVVGSNPIPGEKPVLKPGPQHFSLAPRLDAVYVLGMGGAAGPNIKRLRKAQGGRCYMCARRVTPSGQQWEGGRLFPTLDHIVPRRAGGWRTPPNIALACHDCNQKKGDRMPTACELLFGEVIADVAGIPRVSPWRESPWSNPALADALRAAGVCGS